MMIGVIADDFTGAAEIAGVALRYGLTAEIQTASFGDCSADLLVLDTDSRSCARDRAAQLVTDAAMRLKNAGCDRIYKKVDSAMRGNIAAELAALLHKLNSRRVLLIPANPSFGRTISNGRYFINGRPLDETDFAHDPEHPAVSSDVLELLGCPESMSACVLPAGRPLPHEGVTIGETQNKDDLSVWADKLDSGSIAAGGAEFFAAILENKGLTVKPPKEPDRPPRPARTLVVCGSASRYSRQTLRRAANRGIPICKMPPQLFNDQSDADQLLSRWSHDVVSALQQHSCAMVAIDQPLTRNAALAERLCHHMATVVDNVVGCAAVDELYAEGGATASAIIHRLGWSRFVPRRELVPGVVRMQVIQKQDKYLTVKPGSYAWPESLSFAGG